MERNEKRIFVSAQFPRYDIILSRDQITKQIAHDALSWSVTELRPCQKVNIKCYKIEVFTFKQKRFTVKFLLLIEPFFSKSSKFQRQTVHSSINCLIDASLNAADCCRFKLIALSRHYRETSFFSFPTEFTCRMDIFFAPGG